MATNFEPREYLIFLQSTKIDNHEIKALHSNNSIEPKVCTFKSVRFIFQGTGPDVRRSERPLSACQTHRKYSM